MKISTRLATALCLIGLAACTTIDRANAPKLEGKPEDSAVLVVRAEAWLRGYTNQLSTQAVTGGSLVRTADGEWLHSKADDGYIVFSGLKPGAYRLAVVRASWKDTSYVLENTYSMPEDSSRAFEVELRAGQAKFLGVVSAEDVRRPGERANIVSLKEVKNAEAEAWAWFARVYAKNAWAGEARKRLAELGR